MAENINMINQMKAQELIQLHNARYIWSKDDP